jgi:non-specific serine/threonine protein kinase
VDELALPEPLHHSALASDGSLLYVLGGYRADGSPSAAVYVRGGEAWGTGMPLPAPRAAGAAAWDGVGRVVYGAGVGPNGVAGEVWAITPPNGAWEAIGVLSEAREHLAATSDGAGSVVFVGGRRGGLETNVGTADVAVGGTVRPLGRLPTPRGGVAAFPSAAHGACLVGGESPGGTHGEAECIALDGSVVRLPDLTRPRHGLGAVVLNGTAFALLGGERPGLFVSDVVEVLQLP